MIKEEIKNIIISGGGTGGHLIPGIILAKELKKIKDYNIIFFVPGTRIDKKILAQEKFPYFINPTISYSKDKIKFITNFIRGIRFTLRLFRKYPPSLVIGLGGYGSFIPGLISIIKDIPFVLIEANKIPGKVVRILSLYTQAIYTRENIEKYIKNKKIIKNTGLPVRKEIREVIRKKEKQNNRDKITILILGGSQGSKIINEIIIKSLKYLHRYKNKLYFIHIAGRDKEKIKKVYINNEISHEVYEYYHKIEELYQRSDFIISRAGGSTLAEISLLGIPSLLIPLSWASDNHQYWNAYSFYEKGACFLIEERDLDEAKIKDIIENIIENPNILKNMSEKARNLGFPEAHKKIIEDILSLLK